VVWAFRRGLATTSLTGIPGPAPFKLTGLKGCDEQQVSSVPQFDRSRYLVHHYKRKATLLLARFASLSHSRPSTLLSAKRCCHRHTVGRAPMFCASCCAERRSAQASTMRARSTACGRLRSAGIAANCSRSASSQSHIPSEPSPCSPDLPQYCTSSWVYGSSEWFIALAERRHQRCIYVSFQMVEVAAARQHSGKPCH